MFPHQVTFVYYRYILIHCISPLTCVSSLSFQMFYTIDIFNNETVMGDRVRCYFALLQVVVVGVWRD
jgi:hypothetical protein